jgi:methylated-DNA-[protein]-cysteine S-methyltransferase
VGRVSARVATVATPCGPFTVMAIGDTVVASGWAADGALVVGWMAPAARPDAWTVEAGLGPITDAVHAYFDGDLGAIDAVAVRQQSGPFVESAWDALRALPPGISVTYRDLAARCGRAGAARAAGSACQRNAAALFVPCHRVVRRDGSLGGFRWGLAVKRWLLDYEARSHCGSDGKLAGHGVIGAEAAVDDVLDREHP